MSFNTGNPINSLAEEDFYDNCLSLDQAMNSTDPTWTDRFGVEKPTIDAALKSAGFMPAGFDFVTGGTLQPGDRNKAVYNPAPNGDNNWYRWNGVFPKEIAANSQPNPKDENNWVPVIIKTDVVVREALRRTYQEVGLNLVEGSFEEGGTLNTITDVVLEEKTGFVYSWGGGFPKTISKNSDPSADKDWFNISSSKSLRKDLINSALEIRNSRFSLRDSVSVMDGFGVIADGINDDTLSLQMAIDFANLTCKDLYWPPGKYTITKPLIYKTSGFWSSAWLGAQGGSVITKTNNDKTGATQPDVWGKDWNVDAIIVIPALVNQPKSVFISGLRLMGTETIKPEYGVWSTICENIHLERLFIYNVGVGHNDEGSWICTVEKVIARDVSKGGFRKNGGTSTHYNHCYVDRSGGYGWDVYSGYSGCHHCACDYTKTSSFIFRGQELSSLSDNTCEISNCGSENSGNNSVIRVIGSVFLKVSTYTAFNWSEQQTPTPEYLIIIDTNYTTVILENIRGLGYSKLIKDGGQQNCVILKGVTSRTNIPIGDITVNTRIITEDSSGIRFARGYDLVGIGFGVEDITDSNPSKTNVGLRNKQVILRATVNVPKITGQVYGKITFPIPITLQSYTVAHSVNISDQTPFISFSPVVAITKKTSSIDVYVKSTTADISWSSFDVELIIYGVKP